VSCAVDLEVSTILLNFKSLVFDSVVPEKKCLWNFALDGFACEELFRPGLNGGALRGLCPCAVRAGLNVEPKTAGDVLLVQGMLDDGTVHLSSELLGGAMIPNRRDDNGLRVVLAQGICKHVDANFHKRIIDLVVKIWKTEPGGEQLARAAFDHAV